MKAFDQPADYWGHIPDSLHQDVLDPATLRATWALKISRSPWVTYWKIQDPLPTSLQEKVASKKFWARVKGALDRSCKWEGAIEYQPKLLVYHVFTKCTGSRAAALNSELYRIRQVEYEVSKYNAKRGASYHLQDIHYPSQVIGAGQLRRPPTKRPGAAGTPRRRS